MRFFIIKTPDILETRAADPSLICAVVEHDSQGGRQKVIDYGIVFERCPKCSWLVRRERVRPVCLETDLPLPFHFMPEGHESVFIAADWVSDCFEEENVSGLERSSARVIEAETENEFRSPSGSPGGVFCYDVIGKGGEINVEESAYLDVFKRKGKELKVKRKVCRKCGQDTYKLGKGFFPYKYKRLAFDASAWDGSDCFNVKFLGVVVTERFLEILRSHRIKNWAAMEVYAK